MTDAGTRVARGIAEVDPAPSVVTIGVFDGVHHGHRSLLGRTVADAREAGVRAVAVTFDRHPMEVVRPDAAPPYLQRLDDRIASLAGEGLDLVLVLPFDEQLSRLSPEAFVEQVLAGPLAARRVVVGANFRFGHKAAGDVALLEELGAVHGFDVVPAALADLDGVTVSSTEVRERLARGEVEWASRALGRDFTVSGTVVEGHQRGRSIGVPTANVAVDPRMQVPAAGVYAGRAWRRGSGDASDAVINIGTRPTFEEDGPRSVEAHLLDVELDLYGDELVVAFVSRLRDEQRFDGVEQLVERIHADIAEARRRL